MPAGAAADNSLRVEVVAAGNFAVGNPVGPAAVVEDTDTVVVVEGTDPVLQRIRTLEPPESEHRRRQRNRCFGQNIRFLQQLGFARNSSFLVGWQIQQWHRVSLLLFLWFPVLMFSFQLASVSARSIPLSRQMG